VGAGLEGPEGLGGGEAGGAEGGQEAGGGAEDGDRFVGGGGVEVVAAAMLVPTAAGRCRVAAWTARAPVLMAGISGLR
jgi:hypothetical protein